MGKLQKLSGKDICRILSQHDFIEIRRRGRHIIMQRKIEDNTITIPVPNHKELRIGTPKTTDKIIKAIVILKNVGRKNVFIFYLNILRTYAFDHFHREYRDDLG